MKQYPEIVVPSVTEKDFKLCETFDEALKSKAFKKGLYDVLVSWVSKEELRKYYYIIDRIIREDEKNISLEEINNLEEFLDKNESHLKEYGEDFTYKYLDLPETVDDHNLTPENLLDELKKKIKKAKGKFIISRKVGDDFKNNNLDLEVDLEYLGESGDKIIIKYSKGYLFGKDNSLENFDKIEKTKQKGVYVAEKGGLVSLIVNGKIIDLGNFFINKGKIKEVDVVTKNVFRFVYGEEASGLYEEGDLPETYKGLVLLKEDGSYDIIEDITYFEKVGKHIAAKYGVGSNKKITIFLNNGNKIFLPANYYEIEDLGFGVAVKYGKKNYTFYDLDGNVYEPQNIKLNSPKDLKKDDNGQVYYEKKSVFGTKKVYLSK